MKNYFLIFMAVLLFWISLQLKDISMILRTIQEENTLRVTEINHNQYDIESYGNVVLPDDEFGYKKNN